MSFRDQLKKQLSSNDWKGARKPQPAGRSYQLPDIEDGTYVCRVDKFEPKIVNFSGKDIPIIEATVTIDRGAAEGESVTHSYWLDGSSQWIGSTLSNLATALKVCDPSLEDVLVEMDLEEFLEEVEDICQGVTELHALVRCGIRLAKNGKRYNVYFNENLGESDEQSTEVPFDTDEKEASEDSEEEEEEEEISEIERGDYVLYKPPKARKERECKVVSSSKRRETAKIKDIKTEEVYQVEWSELTLMEEEEE